jgi:hypothetical protein
VASRSFFPSPEDKKDGDRALYYGSATAFQLLMTMADINFCLGI